MAGLLRDTQRLGVDPRVKPEDDELWALGLVKEASGPLRIVILGLDPRIQTQGH